MNRHCIALAPALADQKTAAAWLSDPNTPTATAGVGLDLADV